MGFIQYPLAETYKAYVMFWALLSPVYYWPELGGMFTGPRSTVDEEAKGEAEQPEGKEKSSS